MATDESYRVKRCIDDITNELDYAHKDSGLSREAIRDGVKAEMERWLRENGGPPALGSTLLWVNIIRTEIRRNALVALNL